MKKIRQPEFDSIGGARRARRQTTVHQSPSPTAFFLPLLLLLLFLPVGRGASAQQGWIDYLGECCAKQVPYPGHGAMQLTYREIERRLYHSPRPWMTREISKRGAIVIGRSLMIQHDTTTTGRGEYVTTRQIGPHELLQRNYRGEELSGTTPGELEHQWLRIARYSPIPLLERSRGESPPADLSTREGYALYTITVNGEDLLLSIRTADTLLEEVTRRWHDGMLGDMQETIRYQDFRMADGRWVPWAISIESPEDVHEEVVLTGAVLDSRVEPVLERPDDYRVDEGDEPAPEVTVERITDHLYAVNYLHTESRSILVEFTDYMAVIDVPFDSRNGELLLREAARIAPEKPVRYFAFGHHHPWYLGGVRPFIYNGTTVIATPGNVDYVRYLATASHALQPDSLHLNPRPLRTEIVDSMLTITDGEYRMQIVHIGMRSAHTEDYLLFYFPEERILVQGDLAWVPIDESQRTRSEREEGLLNAIREFGLDVETIIQTWPVSDRYPVKSIYRIEEIRIEN